MAIIKLGTDTNTSYASSSVWSFNFTHTLVAGSNRIIVVGTGGETTLADTSPVWNVDSITYGGAAMTQAVRVVTTETGGGLSNNSSSLWYLLEANLPANGLQTVQINGSGPTSEIEVWGVCTEYGGVYQGGPLTNGVFINSTAPSNTITNTISAPKGSLVRSSYVCGNTGSWTVNNSQVEIIDDSQTTTSYGSSEKVGAVGNETSFSSTFVGTVNRLTRVCAIFRRAPWKVNTVSEAGFVQNVNGVTYGSLGNGPLARINTYDT